MQCLQHDIVDASLKKTVLHDPARSSSSGAKRAVRGIGIRTRVVEAGRRVVHATKPSQAAETARTSGQASSRLSHFSF